MLNITDHQGNTNQNHTEISVTSVRMAIIQKIRDNKCWWGCGERVTTLHCWWECKLVQPLWAAWKFLKKLKIEWPYDPAIPLIGILLKKLKTLIQKDICTSMFIATIFTIAK